MKRIRSLWLIALFSVFAGYSLSRAETTLEKIDRSAVLVIGTRTGSPPFAYVNKNNEWVGFSIDLVEKAILPVLNQKLNKQIKLNLVPTLCLISVFMHVNKASHLLFNLK